MIFISAFSVSVSVSSHSLCVCCVMDWRPLHVLPLLFSPARTDCSIVADADFSVFNSMLDDCSGNSGVTQVGALLVKSFVIT